MTDLRKTFSTLDRLDSPDVWPEVERRGPRPSSDQDTSPGRRLGIILLALVVAAAGFASLVVPSAAARPREPHRLRRSPSIRARSRRSRSDPKTRRRRSLPATGASGSPHTG